MVSGSTVNVIRKHVLLITFPAYGHIIPILELAKRMARSHEVTFAVSECKVEDIKKRELFSVDQENKVRLYGIKDGLDCHLDDPSDPVAIRKVFKHVLSSVQILMDRMPTRNSAVAATGTDAEKIDEPVDIVIADGFVGGPVSTCRSRGIPFYLFNTAAAHLTQVFLSLDRDRDLIPPDENTGPVCFQQRFGPNVVMDPLLEKLKDLLLPITDTIHLATGLIVNSFREIEEKVMKELSQHPSMANVKLYCVGPFLSEETTASKNKTVEIQVDRWLSQKREREVVYVSHGSVAVPSPGEINEIGLGLLELKKPFIWSLRRQHHTHLPKELQARISQQFSSPDSQFLILTWAPQKLILSHPAVAVFLSHCGWNSTLEGLSAGKPIVGWPMFADQEMDALFVEDIGAGLMIKGTGIVPKRTVAGSEVATTIAKVAGWEEPGTSGMSKVSFTAEAEAWGKKINYALGQDGSSTKEFLELVQF
ncbi:hypothetical protein RvY_10534 [Ramazzottius varieornatus]|uniref:UDP-glucuronosyltransferase n=1 Tax=Ramazzottius varieornatus TaxID=947166 RepID=A0A1D1VIF0_RAMVA|nr:hypothetical protein RvY_10534 [Ramazzottius varieornatus]